ncbi:MAG: histidine--tRNA ligase [Planctomycetaceae bacterium]|nr:histidine--tRNA ligase [Planctomycetaceae bacterium]
MKFQAPKGTRDFYPAEMAWRRWLEGKWRAVSIRNGFEEVEGPIFETLELYTAKSGDEIVNQLFQVTREGSDKIHAIRPEFTPTLARMVAEKANALPKPIKWFSIPNLCRGEQPQRGRLREFLQWNIDMMGIAEPIADAECIFTTVDLLSELGLAPNMVKVKISHRDVVRRILSRLGVADDHMVATFELLDRREKLPDDVFRERANAIGLDGTALERLDQVALVRYPTSEPWDQIKARIPLPESDLEDLADLHDKLRAFGIDDWCEYDLGIVRGLAYYTGTVFEIHEITGAERAMAGGGRYDQLIESVGGPPTPAVGMGMGDVVLSLVLQDKGLLPHDVMPQLDAFVIAAAEAAQSRVPDLVATLRAAGLHARFSYRSTTNVGKLLKEAAQHHARAAVILDDNTLSADTVAVKDLATGEQTDVPSAELTSALLHSRR